MRERASWMWEWKSQMETSMTEQTQEGSPFSIQFLRLIHKLARSSSFLSLFFKKKDLASIVPAKKRLIGSQLKSSCCCFWFPNSFFFFALSTSLGRPLPLAKMYEWMDEYIEREGDKKWKHLWVCLCSEEPHKAPSQHPRKRSVSKQGYKDRGGHIYCICIFPSPFSPHVGAFRWLRRKRRIKKKKIVRALKREK